MIQKIYLRFFIKSGFPYAAWLKRRGVLSAQGEGCFIAKSANIPDPYLTRIGDNVWLTDGCHLLCHDASVVMINRMTGRRFDSVGPIVMGDHVFLGNNVIVLPETTLGSRVVVGAGSVVVRDIPDDSVWAGNPARRICSFENYQEKIEAKTRQYPWAGLLAQKPTAEFDPVWEQQLRVQRIHYFFERAA